MDQEATGIENIRMRGVMMGLSLKKISKLEGEIADFSELGEFLKLPIRTYSSGMQMRLAFAISTVVKPDILIMDEWLSVGDGAFQEKAENRLSSLFSDKSILILASHSKELLKKTCNRFIQLDHGNAQELSDL
jgi:lipopolysaccharide transport system ATP-binding protein